MIVTNINRIFETINIYRSLIIFDDSTRKKMGKLEKELKKKDFPLYEVSSESTAQDVKDQRMYYKHEDMYDNISRVCDYDSLTVIFCLSQQLFNKIISRLPQKDDLIVCKL